MNEQHETLFLDCDRYLDALLTDIARAKQH